MSSSQSPMPMSVPYSTNPTGTGADDDNDDEYSSTTIQWFVNIMQGVRYDFWYYVNMLFIIVIASVIIYFLFFRRAYPAPGARTLVVDGGGQINTHSMIPASFRGPQVSA